MEGQFSRTELLLGEERMGELFRAKVAIFGIGGVGGYVAEALARSGVGHFALVDSDVVALSNLNRQIIATYDTIGKYKVEAMRDRILSIHPKAEVEIHKCFFLPGNREEFDFSSYSYVVDAVDTVTAKIELALEAERAGVPIISSMGAGNKLDPAAFQVADIYETSICPLARVMRRELKKRGVGSLKVVYSKEEPIKPRDGKELEKQAASEGGEGKSPFKKATPGSVAFVPSVAGLILAGEVIKDLCGINNAADR